MMMRMTMRIEKEERAVLKTENNYN